MLRTSGGAPNRTLALSLALVALLPKLYLLESESKMLCLGTTMFRKDTLRDLGILPNGQRWAAQGLGEKTHLTHALSTTHTQTHTNIHT